MKTFKSIFEAKEKSAVFTFGRFNPPTVGHAKLIDKLVASSAGGYDPLVFMSHSQDAKKNPLDYTVKTSFMKKFFSRKVGIVNTKARQVFEIATQLYDQGYRNIRMVVGSDRIREFETLLKKYNGSKGRHGYYKFSSIDVISAGERDPDAEDVSGMSASKMRAAAEDGDFDSFEMGVPDKKHAKTLWKAVLKGMNIKEESMPNYMFEDLIIEGVYDQGIFKALFLMGGPGSGKSTVVDAMNLKNLGFKIINSDTHFERLMKTANMSMKMTQTGSGTVNPKRDALRDKGKKIAGKQMDMYITSRLGLIFDTTSAKAAKIQAYKKNLDTLGYEYKMVFVKTSLQLAQRLNSMRARTVPPEILQMEHEAVEKNAAAFKKMFGKDFIEIENDDTVASLKTKADKLYGHMMSWAGKFPSNKKALAWKEAELTKKKR
jgi:predicted kinase